MHPKRKANPKAKRPKVPNKDMDRLVAVAWDAGWWCQRGKKNYISCYHPSSGDIVPVPSTPSSRWTYRTKRAQFRRAGLDV